MAQFKYSLRNGSKKEICPGCQKKTFVPYIETETGHEVGDAGRCDREQNCGYFKKPESNDVATFKKPEVPEVKTDYLPQQLLESLYIKSGNNSFLQYLLSKFTKAQVVHATEMYFLCSYTDSAVIFWQIDIQERIRSGKVILYNPVTGKRVKDPNGRAAINWMHKQPFNLKQCLFGLHLLKEYPSKPVAIVESEKTAVVMSIKEPRFVWLACGSVNGFKTDMLAPARLRKIIGFPDKGCFEAWHKTAELLNGTGFNIIVSNMLEKNNTLNEGDDLADLL